MLKERMNARGKPLAEVMADLEGVAGDAPFLALGQTVFWDEPMKAGVALLANRLGYPRRLVAGVHDTDYFAKLPPGVKTEGRYKAVPHNDTTTRGLWSAAGEFSALFGSETVITRDALQTAGLRIAMLQRARPQMLDEATEAYGWRGVVATGENTVITAELPLKPLVPELMATFDWATRLTLGALGGEGRETAERLVDELRGAICDETDDPNRTVGEFYERLLPLFYNFSANTLVDIDTTRTSELLKFNRETAGRPRFELFDLFVNPATRPTARAAYDEAVRESSSGLYALSRFGVGAIPFDLIIPGVGRGTIRLGTRGAVINTPKPQFLSYRRAPASVHELAELIETKFGPKCVVVGKAVSLIGMLAREFVFVFHEGASSYVKHSRRMHERLAEAGYPLRMNPILRIRYDAWSSLKVCCSWLRLPEPFQRAFGTEELCAPSFSARWREVVAEQREVLNRLGELRRPIDLIRFLDEALGGSWRRLAEEYEGLHRQLADLESGLAHLKSRRHELYDEIRSLRKARVEAEVAKGRHWRDRIFEKTPSPGDLRERERLTEAVHEILRRRAESESAVTALRHEQNDMVRDPAISRIHERRRSIELEAELKRLRLIRDAVTSSRGLEQANRRPSAWWFRLVCPDGLWFRETVETAECYLEPL
jgi:hypothetical protein